MEIQKKGYLLMKLLVPSIGSIIHRIESSPLSTGPDSSAKKLDPGKYCNNIFIIFSSTFKSVSVTHSL